MAFSHVPVALKMILQSGSIGKAAPSYGELCRFESGLCNRAPYTNTVRWPGFPPHILTRSGGQAFNLEIRVQVPLG